MINIAPVSYTDHHKRVSKCNIFLCPHLPKAGVGHIAFRRDVTSVRAYVYVTFVTRFKFTCKFRCNFTSVFLLQPIIFIPFGLES